MATCISYSRLGLWTCVSSSQHLVTISATFKFYQLPVMLYNGALSILLSLHSYERATTSFGRRPSQLSIHRGALLHIGWQQQNRLLEITACLKCLISYIYFLASLFTYHFYSQVLCAEYAELDVSVKSLIISFHSWNKPKLLHCTFANIYLGLELSSELNYYSY